MGQAGPVATLTLRCFLGHRLGLVRWDGDALHLDPYRDPQHPMGWGRRAADRAQLAAIDASLADLSERVAGLDGTYVVHPDWIAPDRPCWSLPTWNHDADDHTASTWTPDGRALDWACMACYRSGLSGATRHERDRPWHYGRTERVWLARALAALVVTGRDEAPATPTTAGLRAALDEVLAAPVAAEHERKRLARTIDAAPLAGLVPDDETYARWTHAHRMTASPYRAPHERFR